MDIDKWFHVFMFDELYGLIYKLCALISCNEGYNLLVCGIRKLYLLIAYLIIPYGNMNTVKLLHLSRHTTDYMPLLRY